MNILIVDDKPNLIRVTAVALRTLGCQAFGASNCAEATQLLATQKIDAVFLDVNLNGENGFAFLSQLGTRPGGPAVIIFTSHTREEVAAEARTRGAFDCLIKPFTLDDLRQQLARIKQHQQFLAGNHPATPHAHETFQDFIRRDAPGVSTVARQAARLAFPENRIEESADLDAALLEEPSNGCQLLVLAAADAATVARASQAIDGNGLPRWAVVALGPDASDLVETVPPPDWNPPLLARVFRAALLQHELLRENLRLRGDLKSVARRVTHDLRTPVGCILTTAQVLPELDAASLPGMAGIIRQSSEEISQIISRVSFVLRASAEPAALGPVNLGQVTGVALQQLAAEINEGGAEVVSPAIWPDVTGVGSWLQVIWWNLLSNALRHGGPRSRIQITWTQAGGECRFSVADRGAGVPAARQTQLFAPFDQLHERNVPGLGLAIVHRLVSLQGGRCHHENPPEGGACFSFTLPAPPAPG